MKTFEELGISVPVGHSGEFATTCPQCSSIRKNKTARCLSVNVDKGVWKCNHCDWRGSLLAGIYEHSNHNAQRPKIFCKPEYSYAPTPSDKMLDLFTTRCIPADVVLRNKISEQKTWMPQIEEFAMAIRIPFLRNGEVVNIKSRDYNKNFRLETGAERIMYGMDDCIGYETLIFVEGELDKLSCEVAGFLNCVSVPDGAPPPTSQGYTSKFSYLESAEEFLNSFKKFVLAVDNDPAGQKLEEELVRRLGAENCLRVEFPNGCKDANEVLMKHGAATLKQCIDNACPYPVAGIFDVTDFSNQIDHMYENGLPSGALPGWHTLNALITFQPGQWTIVTGIPGHGKSEFLDAIMVNLANNYDWKFAIFSPENQPIELHFQKLAEKYIGKPFFNHNRMSMHDMQTAKDWVGDHFTFILPESDGLSIDNILNLAKITVRRKGITGLIIDPWNELDHSRPPTLSETEHISSVLTKIRRFARENKVHVWLVAHPAKLRKEKNEKGNMAYPVPTPYDISGSAHWRNKADNCITVYRDVINNDGLVEIHVQKVRFKHCGKTGAIKLRYDRKTGRYEVPCEIPLDLDDDDN